MHKCVKAGAEDWYSSVEEDIKKRNEYWCDNCQIETSEEICPVCGKSTVEQIKLRFNL